MRLTVQATPRFSRAQVNRSLIGLGLGAAGCELRTPNSPPGTGAAADAGSIPLGPEARVQAVLVSGLPTTAFTISGVGAGADLVLPRTSIARVLLPRAGITITAQAPCFRTLQHHVQAGTLGDGDPITFTFSNIDRRAGCAEEAHAAAATGPAPADPGRLAWVIGNGAYGADWPPLGIVAADRQGMARVLRQAGYRVTVSADRGRAGLLENAATFRAALAEAAPSIAIIYVSGHGLSLDGRNFLVPVDAPATAAVRPEHLLGLDVLVQVLRPVEAAGGCAVLLADACRAVAGPHVPPLVAEPPRGVMVNHATAPGGTSFDGDRGMSAWTDRFVTVAEEFPDAAIDQVLGYANRYTRWQSEASRRRQVPVLYGAPATPVPAFGAGPPPARSGVLPRLPIAAG
ncbi:caspase family protein [Dankookia rubra]|uniref:caspase family protein n=1 Tax=Dankookia rubra TaxID=1442381 RepID=UPI0014075432|nr:caspase family protein [Dankookia rubra]